MVGLTGKFDSDTPAIMQTPIARIPPTTASGIVAMTAPTFVNKPRRMRIIPASCMVKRLATRVIDTTATFSEATGVMDKVLPSSHGCKQACLRMW